jgi:hypothetical protein
VFAEDAFVVSDGFATQRLTLETSVSPIAPRSHSKSDRKRALLNANYYSECVYNRIPPQDAVGAADDAQGQYQKWWIDSKYRGQSIETPAPKKQRLSQRDGSSTIDDALTIVSRQSHYHEVAESSMIQEVSLSACVQASRLTALKSDVMDHLLRTGGDTTTTQCIGLLEALQQIYQSRNHDVRWTGNDASDLDGTWLTLSKPTYAECLGRNAKNQYQYTLGRMSFDMFRPTQVRCSIQGTFNRIGSRTDCSIPKRLKKGYTELPVVRSYDIIVAFTIEANQTRRGTAPIAGEYAIQRPIRALLTNHGFCIPDPSEPNRLSVWFSGGTLEAVDEEREWQTLFQETPRRDLGEYARVLAAKFLLGAQRLENDDGTYSYRLNRPIGGHGQVFCDVLYADDDFRIVRGHHGSIFVFRRVPTACL